MSNKWEGAADSSASLIQGAWAKLPAWFFDRRVLCHGVTPLFYPDRHSGEVMEAKNLCFQCPFQRECLEWALENNEKHGVWGGTSERERRKIKRARRKLEAAAAEKRQAEEQVREEPVVHVIKVKRRFTRRRVIKVKRNFTRRKKLQKAS